MTKKTRIETEMDELLEYLGIDQLALRKLVHVGVERLLGLQIDSRINAYLKNDPPTNLKKEM